MNASCRKSHGYGVAWSESKIRLREYRLCVSASAKHRTVVSNTLKMPPLGAKQRRSWAVGAQGNDVARWPVDSRWGCGPVLHRAGFQRLSSGPAGTGRHSTGQGQRYFGSERQPAVAAGFGDDFGAFQNA